METPGAAPPDDHAVVPSVVPSGATEATPRLPELLALGYSGWDETEDDDGPAPASGVIQFDPARAQDWIRVWADDGSTLHRILPSGERLPSIEVPGRSQVEFARVLEGGRLLCLSVDEGITLLEPGGELVFQVDLAAHHDAVVVPDGSKAGDRTFAVLVHRERSYRGRSVRFDGIALVSEATGLVICLSYTSPSPRD